MKDTTSTRKPPAHRPCPTEGMAQAMPVRAIVWHSAHCSARTSVAFSALEFIRQAAALVKRLINSPGKNKDCLIHDSLQRRVLHVFIVPRSSKGNLP
jgi:hypothetical protein